MPASCESRSSATSITSLNRRVAVRRHTISTHGQPHRLDASAPAQTHHRFTGSALSQRAVPEPASAADFTTSVRVLESSSTLHFAPSRLCVSATAHTAKSLLWNSRDRRSSSCAATCPAGPQELSTSEAMVKVYGATLHRVVKEIPTHQEGHRGGDRMSDVGNPSGEPPAASWGVASRTEDTANHVEWSEA